MRQNRKENDGEKCSSASRDSCKEHFALNFFQRSSVHQQSAKLQLKLILYAQVLQF